MDSFPKTKIISGVIGISLSYYVNYLMGTFVECYRICPTRESESRNEKKLERSRTSCSMAPSVSYHPV